MRNGSHTMSEVSRLARISLIVCLAPWGALAQDNSYAVTLQNNAMWGANLTKQMINLGGTPTTGGGHPSPASCMPPVDLQRGADGHVPPELQRDPRYQEYLRCKRGYSNPQNAASPAAPAPLPTGHLPITATDFVPARPGHPTIDRAINNMSITPEQRQQVHDEVDEMFRRVASQYRRNNLAVSVGVAYATSMTTLNGSQMNQQQSLEFIYGINDQLAQSPNFGLMSAQQKQDESDTLIFQSAIISALRDGRARSPQVNQQAQELSHVVLRQFGSDVPASMPSKDKIVLGVKLGPVIPAVAAAAGFQGSDGAFVIEVSPASAAERAGIKAGDILVRLGDRDIKTTLDVQNAMAFMSPGKVIPNQSR